MVHTFRPGLFQGGGIRFSQLGQWYAHYIELSQRDISIQRVLKFPDISGLFVVVKGLKIFPGNGGRGLIRTGIDFEKMIDQQGEDLLFAPLTEVEKWK